jgi:BirA family biotin operon repressor/biotin-[acetyl-CoA-carboxylase] ligase
LTTFPDRFKEIHLAACDSTSDYLKRNITRLEVDFPVAVSAAVQTAGRGRENRAWISPENLGIYVTFGFHLPDQRSLSLLSIASGIAVCAMLRKWTGKEFALKWPNDILVDGKKIAGILCETIIKGDRIACLVGIGVNVNHLRDDFPPELRGHAGSLRLLTGREWPLAEGRERLAAGMAAWMGKLVAGRSAVILRRARALSRPLLGKEIAFHHQGRVWRGTFHGLAADGALMLETGAGEMKTFHNGEIAGQANGVRP